MDKYRIKQPRNNAKAYPCTKGRENDIHNFSEFKKQFTFKQETDKKGKEIYYVQEKAIDFGYGYEATGLDKRAVEWELYRCFKSRTQRYYKNDVEEYVVVVLNMDWTRCERFFQYIPDMPRVGGWYAWDNGRIKEGRCTKVVFKQKKHADQFRDILHRWYR